MMPENPSAPRDLDMEEAAFWLQGYCELATESLETLRQNLLDLHKKIGEISKPSGSSSGSEGEGV